MPLAQPPRFKIRLKPILLTDKQAGQTFRSIKGIKNKRRRQGNT
ncbi:hypothetical protein Cabys_3683 [Caldithrix abyssi DSM 13497]|uniref:Uncharacterized protein n=1 Tax=Caldithrix abyssi DSM 13497 TaxID=880073 RepID=A0A1J1CCI8_CALAY|nr:hypothetical protein Cabys_3683 [Caldithrix abyssi DSM 13497]